MGSRLTFIFLATFSLISGAATAAGLTCTSVDDGDLYHSPRITRKLTLRQLADASKKWTVEYSMVSDFNGEESSENLKFRDLLTCYPVESNPRITHCLSRDAIMNPVEQVSISLKSLFGYATYEAKLTSPYQKLSLQLDFDRCEPL